MRVETTALTGATPGTRREVTLYRFGTPGAGTKVYLQAGLHADELPGVLILQHFLDLMQQAEAQDAILGEVLVVPMANPIGLSNWQFQRPQGRHDPDTLQNYNRNYPDLADLVGDTLVGKLTASAATNQTLIRAAFRNALSGMTPKTDLEELQITLLHWSCDADYVLDLHCDHHAILHLYAASHRPADTTALCRATGAELALIQDVSGGLAFDEAHSVPWMHLRDRFAPDHPVPIACFSTTLEYRGQFDVDDTMAQQDAANLMGFLGQIGVLKDIAAPRHADAVHLPLGGAAEVFAPQGGVVTWAARPGDWVAAGQVLGNVTDPVSRRRLALTAPQDGLLFRIELWPSCTRGQGLAHVAGESVVRSGNLLSY